MLTVICPSIFGGPASNLDIQDSGGFQMVSLSSFSKVTEEGVLFASPFTGEPTMLTVSYISRTLSATVDRGELQPEESMSIQV